MKSDISDVQYFRVHKSKEACQGKFKQKTQLRDHSQALVRYSDAQRIDLLFYYHHHYLSYWDLTYKFCHNYNSVRYMIDIHRRRIGLTYNH